VHKEYRIKEGMRAGRCGTEKISQKQTKAHRYTKYKIEGNDHFRTQSHGIWHHTKGNRRMIETVRLVVSTLLEHMGQKHTSFTEKECYTPLAPYEHQNRSKHSLFILNLTQYTIYGEF